MQSGCQDVAEALIQVFTSVGYPQEILTDQDLNFMSTLMVELFRMLGVMQIKTLPYHPQADGMMERFNACVEELQRP